MLKAYTQRLLCACFTLSLLLAAANSYACDENCKRKKAEQRLNVSFPSYLSKRYCRDVSGQFLTTASKSLRRYRENKLADLHRGSMFYTREFIVQRKGWLKECDDYLKEVSRYRVFRSADTTQQIFTAMDEVSYTLGALVNGATFVSNNEGYDSLTAISEPFDRLLELLDAHKTQMQLAGQLNID